MKTFVCFVVVSCLAAFVVSEHCFEQDDCNHVTCDSTHTLECHKPSGTAPDDMDVAGECTCTDTRQSCTAQSDCSGDCGRTWHCVDNGCRCGYGFPRPPMRY